MSSFRTPFARVQGLGSAKHGVGHFIGQRVSAVALVVLVLWGVASVLGLARADFGAAVQWIRSPWNALPTTLFVAVSAYHMQLGMRTIIEDYIHRSLTKQVLVLASQLLCWTTAAVGVFSILKVAFSGGAI